MTVEQQISFAVPAELEKVVESVREFIAQDVLPREDAIGNLRNLLDHWHVVEDLRNRAKERAIFTPHLPVEWGGLGLGTLGMALVSQECGASFLASLALNAMAPDEGNMHTILHAGTPEQQERWLRPLAQGSIRSCFAMTEPDVASSDPFNLQTTATRDGDEWVINGHKWFITGAIGAAIAIVVARTGQTDGGRDALSLFLVPTDTAGWRVVRDPEVIGAHAPGGHPEIVLENVRVPTQNLLGAQGAGYEILQRRLAGGRLAHAMRWIGTAQRALDLTAARMLERKAFGTTLAGHQALQFLVADSAIDLYASRMMVLNAAWRVDQGIEHRQEIAMVKTFVSEALGRILDRAVQVHGSHGIAMDRPIAQWYADSRAARIYDGASEVHRMAIARRCLRLAADGRSLADACGHPMR